MDNNNQNPDNNNSSPITNPLANPAPSSKLSDAFATNSISSPPSSNDHTPTNPLEPKEPSWPTPVASQTPNQNPPAEKPIPTFNPPLDVTNNNAAEPGLPDNLAAILNPPNPEGNLNSTPQTGPSASSIPPIIPPEPAPTDLSQLTGNNDQPPPPEIYTPPVSNSENLVVPNAPVNPESIDVSSHHSSLSKFLIIGGILMVLLVGAGSAYFILGVGKPQSPTPTPQPTETSKATPTPQPSSPEASPSTSTGFGDLNGSTATGSSKPKSALELLKERQSPSPTPRR